MMKSILAHTILLVGVVSPQAAVPAGKTQQLTSPDQVPEGLAKSDRSSIRAAYEAGRHAFQPVQGKDGIWQARNQGQQWLTTFDQHGFAAQPQGGGWSWGLELKSYGFEGKQTPISGEPMVKAAGQRLSYQWDATVQEWWINDPRGLEHGFTVAARPAASLNSQATTLNFLLSIRGTLKPSLTADAKGLLFQDATGATVLNYTGLKVWDADGQELPSGFEMSDSPPSPHNSQPTVRLLVDERNARYPITIDPIAQQAYLKASNTGANDKFGTSVAVSGDTVVIGAPGESSNATGVGGNQADNSANASGAAYVFTRIGGVWSQHAYLKASNTGTGDQFGYSVAVSGDTVVVGAFAEASNATGVNAIAGAGTGTQADNTAYASGAVYVFTRSGGIWSQHAYLKASNTGTGDQFGYSVAVSGDTVAIGARFERSNSIGVNGSETNDLAPYSGAAYVFTRSGGVWSQQAYLKASNTDTGDEFGFDVAVSSDILVVGAKGESSNTTGINSHISGGTGTQTDNSAINSGAAYVFTRSGGVWSQQAYLKASNTEEYDYFGYSVAVSGDTVAVGACQEATGVGFLEDYLSGAAYVFTRTGGVWSQQAYLKASNTNAFYQFGWSVDIDGDMVVVGAPFEPSNATGVNGNQGYLAENSGAAYVFIRSAGLWSQHAYLKASNTGEFDFFGTAVAVSGDKIIVGAINESSNAIGLNASVTGSTGTQADNSLTQSGAAYIYSIDPLTTTAVIEVANFSLTSGDTSLVTFTYSEAVLSFTTADLIIENGIISDPISNDGGITWTAIFTPYIGIADTINIITLDVSGVTDLAGNASSGMFISNSFSIDTTVAEIVVKDAKGISLDDDVSTVDFGASSLGSSVSMTFTVQNIGTYQLTGLGITIDNATDFTVTSSPASPVLPGESTSFTVKFQPSTLGARTGALHLASNDDDEPSFDFILAGRTHALSFEYGSLDQREDQVSIKVPVHMSSAFGTAFNVNFTIGGTATASDYTVTTLSPIKFTATQTVAYITIMLKDDQIIEGDDTLTITLGTPNVAGVTVVTPSVFSLSIIEDDEMPVITPTLVSQIVAVGDEVSFSCGATGSAPLVLAWKKNGVTIASATTGTYGFTSASLTHGAAYTITASNQRGKVSSTAQLAVMDRDEAVIRANVGSSPTMSVSATGNNLIYRWRDVNGDLPITGSKYVGVTTKTLIVKSAVASDSGRYTCMVTAPGGSLESGGRQLQVPSEKPVADTPAFPDVVVYNSFSYQLTFDSDPTRAPTKFICSGLPTGVICNAATGLITGTPTQIGDFTVIVTLSSSVGIADIVQDTFSVIKYPLGAVGVYAGVVGRDAKANINFGGRIDLTTTTTGAYTGTLRLGASAHPLKGTLLTAPMEGAYPGVTLTLARRNQLPVVLVLIIDPLANDLTGTLGEQGSDTNATISGWRNVWRTNVMPIANPVVGQFGGHSFMIDPASTGPQGYGYGTINVTKAGGTSVNGRMADGGVITTSGVLGPDGQVLVYSMLYSNKGSILGTIGIDSDATHTINSTLDWQKTLATTARDYAPFGPLSVAVLGGKYSITTPVLNLPALSNVIKDNAQFTFSDGGLPSATNPNMKLRISNTNLLTLNPINPGKINSLVFTSATGSFSGKMTLTDPPAIPRMVTFQGWLVPTQGKGYGYFLLPELANPLANPPTTATTSSILSGKVLLEAVEGVR